MKENRNTVTIINKMSCPEWDCYFSYRLFSLGVPNIKVQRLNNLNIIQTRNVDKPTLIEGFVQHIVRTVHE